MELRENGTGYNSRVMSAGAYCSILPAILFLLVEPFKRDGDVRFASWQCIWLTVVALALQMIAQVLPREIGPLFSMAAGLLIFVVWVVVLIQAFRGKRVKLPIIGNLAERQAGAVA